MEKKQKELEEKLLKKEANRAKSESVQKIIESKQPESEIIKTTPEQPIEENVESKP